MELFGLKKQGQKNSPLLLIIVSILHDSKTTSFKMHLLRSSNHYIPNKYSILGLELGVGGG